MLQYGTLHKWDLCKDLLSIARAIFHKNAINVLGSKAVKDYKLGNIKQWCVKLKRKMEYGGSVLNPVSPDIFIKQREKKLMNM